MLDCVNLVVSHSDTGRMGRMGRINGLPLVGDILMITYIHNLILMLGFDLSEFLFIDTFITGSQESP